VVDIRRGSAETRNKTNTVPGIRLRARKRRPNDLDSIAPKHLVSPMTSSARWTIAPSSPGSASCARSTRPRPRPFGVGSPWLRATSSSPQTQKTIRWRAFGRRRVDREAVACSIDYALMRSRLDRSVPTRPLRGCAIYALRRSPEGRHTAAVISARQLLRPPV
jgi:hypothetical protein